MSPLRSVVVHDEPLAPKGRRQVSWAYGVSVVAGVLLVVLALRWALLTDQPGHRGAALLLVGFLGGLWLADRLDRGSDQ